MMREPSRSSNQPLPTNAASTALHSTIFEGLPVPFPGCCPTSVLHLFRWSILGSGQIPSWFSECSLQHLTCLCFTWHEKLTSLKNLIRAIWLKLISRNSDMTFVFANYDWISIRSAQKLDLDWQSEQGSILEFFRWTQPLTAKGFLVSELLAV